MTGPARWASLPRDIAHALDALLNGYTVTTVRDGTERIDVVARAVPQERLSLDQLSDRT
ncbi:MAG: efflux RND transporter permease subunit [Acetobacteraceae bacterium]|nr:efflux RND transporter permease subunit [Acetobacteraceae bacterium]MBV8523787.1 efflux RND transporter permease subunit [Acetobacteraceae bacterium]